VTGLSGIEISGNVYWDSVGTRESTGNIFPLADGGDRGADIRVQTWQRWSSKSPSYSTTKRARNSHATGTCGSRSE